MLKLLKFSRVLINNTPQTKSTVFSIHHAVSTTPPPVSNLVLGFRLFDTQLPCIYHLLNVKRTTTFIRAGHGNALSYFQFFIGNKQWKCFNDKCTCIRKKCRRNANENQMRTRKQKKFFYVF